LTFFPYLSDAYRSFISCYFKCYQQGSKIHKPYGRTIAASATRTMGVRGAAKGPNPLSLAAAISRALGA
jgi:hypothetical protein